MESNGMPPSCPLSAAEEVAGKTTAAPSTRGVAVHDRAAVADAQGLPHQQQMLLTETVGAAKTPSAALAGDQRAV